MVFEEKMITNGDPEEEEEEEEEMVDPLETIRQKCEETEHCVHAREKLESCETRVGSRSETTEDCTEELFDFLHARDHCEEEEEEEMVDPLETIRQKCEETEHCVHAREKLESCETRVGSRSETTEDCTEELFDFLHARDHCVAHKLFHSVK